jgi:copper transport protein
MRLLAGLAALLLAACFATGAAAHAALLWVEPADGSVLAAPPKTVELRFSEGVTPGAIRLIDAEGRTREDARVSAAGETIAVTVPGDLPRGSSIVSYRVISEDGHPVSGSVTFSVGAPSATALPAKADGVVNSLIWLTRIGLYLGLFAGVGGAFFASWIAASADGSGVIGAALVAGLCSAVASIGLLGVDLLGLSVPAMLTLAPWKVALATSAGPALLTALAAMVAAMIARGIRQGTASRILSAAALVGSGLTLAASGHAATAPPRALTIAAVFLHGVGVAFWIGALAPLAMIVATRKPGALAIVNRFSRIATAVVALLALTGFALAVVQLQSADALVETRYGIILSIKLALVAVLLALAALNRFRLTPALAKHSDAARPLARSILAEIGLACAILAAVAGWRFTPPPRALALETPLAIHIHGEKAMFQVLVSPGRIGSDDFVLQLMATDGTMLPAKEVTLTLSLPERGIEPMEREAALGRDSYWHVRKLPLPVAGRWRIRIDALVTDFEKITLEDELDVAPK